MFIIDTLRENAQGGRLRHAVAPRCADQYRRRALLKAPDIADRIAKMC